MNEELREGIQLSAHGHLLTLHCAVHEGSFGAEPTSPAATIEQRDQIVRETVI
jgi:hypothetical protein